MISLHLIATALTMAFTMFWKVGWSLVLGFLISAVLQTLVPRQRIIRTFSGNGLRPIAIATGLGIASSSCSYAAASISRTLFRKGAGLVPSLAFLFASTNLVIELGIVLYLLLGWQFLLGEWIGGIVLIALMAMLVKLTYPKALVEAARHYGGDARQSPEPPDIPLRRKLRDPNTAVAIARHFASDWRMLWKDIALGFLIAGALSAFVPEAAWQHLFVPNARPWLQVPANAVLGPIVAALSFVCSIGNVPMAATLWGAGVSFGGVLAFLYADLIVLPLLSVYRRYYGWKMMLYITTIFYTTMVTAGIIMDIAFSLLDVTPSHHLAPMQGIKLNYTAFLNVLALLITVVLFVWSRRAALAAQTVKIGSITHE